VFPELKKEGALCGSAGRKLYQVHGNGGKFWRRMLFHSSCSRKDPQEVSKSNWKAGQHRKEKGGPGAKIIRLVNFRTGDAFIEGELGGEKQEGAGPIMDVTTIMGMGKLVLRTGKKKHIHLGKVCSRKRKRQPHPTEKYREKGTGNHWQSEKKIRLKQLALRFMNSMVERSALKGETMKRISQENRVNALPL